MAIIKKLRTLPLLSVLASKPKHVILLSSDFLLLLLGTRDGIEPGPNPKARRLAQVFRGSHQPAARTMAREPEFSPKITYFFSYLERFLHFWQFLFLKKVNF